MHSPMDPQSTQGRRTMASQPDDAAKLGAFVRDQARRKHIVMVDSSQVFLHIIAEVLKDERYGVTTSNYVPEIFTQIALLTPDLIIIDLTITEKAGWDLLEQLELESLTRDIPVIVTSTNRHLLDRALANKDRYGFDNYLVKPFDLDVLLAAIEELIGAA